MHRCDNWVFRTWGVSALALLSISMAPALRAQPKFLRGDLNGDGRVTYADAGYFVEAAYFQGPLPRCIKAADLNDSGIIELQQGPLDLDRLLGFLFRTASPPPLPFPQPGTDPTQDNLTCADATIQPPGPPDPRYAFAWEGDLYLRRGAQDQEIFLQITTAGPITGFSMACRVDRKVLTNLRVDFKGTIVPAAAQGDLLQSPLFRVRVTQSSTPGYDLLLIGCLFVAEPSNLAPKGLAGLAGLERISLPATTGPVTNARICRLLADVSSGATVSGLRISAIVPNVAEDLIQGSGVLAELFSLDTAIDPFGDFEYAPVLVDTGEFFRADANGDACRDLSDPVHTLSYLFLGGPAPRCPDASDANDDGAIDISDATFTLNFLFSGGRAPPTAPFVDPEHCWFDLAGDALGECEYECRECPR